MWATFYESDGGSNLNLPSEQKNRSQQAQAYNDQRLLGEPLHSYISGPFLSRLQLCRPLKPAILYFFFLIF